MRRKKTLRVIATVLLFIFMAALCFALAFLLYGVTMPYYEVNGGLF